MNRMNWGGSESWLKRSDDDDDDDDDDIYLSSYFIIYHYHYLVLNVIIPCPPSVLPFLPAMQRLARCVLEGVSCSHC